MIKNERVTPTVHSSDREAWLAARRNYITASDAAVLLGMGRRDKKTGEPFRTVDQIRAEKLGLLPEWQGDDATSMALDLEPWIIGQARKRLGWQIQDCGVLMIDTECPRLAGTPDAIASSPWGDFVVQIKVTSCQPRELCKPGSTAEYADGPPIYYQIQCQAEMAVTGLAHAALLVLHTSPRLALRSYYIPRHHGVVDRLRRAVVEFWRNAEAVCECI